MRRLIFLLLFAIAVTVNAAPVDTRVFEAPSAEVFETAIKAIRVKDTTAQRQDFSLGTSWTCQAGDAFKINRDVKPVLAGIADLDMAAGVMTIAYQYEVRPSIEDGAVEYACSKYGTNGVCQTYACRVTKEPVFGDATKVVHARRVRFTSAGTKYTVSFEVVPTETQFRRELETGTKLSQRERGKLAREEAEMLFDSLKDTLDGMSRNAANSGRKLQKAESFLTEADRAATGPAGLYRLLTIDGQPLPYTTIMMSIEVAEGSLILHADGKYTQTLITSRGSVQTRGTYKLTGTSVVLVDKGAMMAGKLTGDKELSISGSYGRLVFAK